MKHLRNPVRAVSQPTTLTGRSVPPFIDENIVIWGDPFGYHHVAYPIPYADGVTDETLKKAMFDRIAWEREKVDYVRHSTTRETLLKRYSSVFDLGRVHVRMVSGMPYVVASEIDKQGDKI